MATLSSTDVALSVPASVNIPAGSSTATFTASAVGVIASDRAAVVAAKLGASSGTATVNLTAATLVSSMACNPSSLGANASSTCTVTLSKAAPAGGAVVTLVSNNSKLTVPASVTVAAIATSAVFSATTAAVASDQSAIVTATYNGSSATSTVTLVAATLVSSVACSPSSLGANASSTCTVTLSKAAPIGGAVITLASNNATLAVPASVMVAATATSAAFSATTTAVASDQNAIVTATYNGSSATNTVSLVAATLVSSVACNPSSLGANGSSTCTVTLSKAAPAGGAVVTLVSNNSKLTVPASVTVAATVTSAVFSATTGAVASDQSAIVTATYNGSSATSTVSLIATTLVSSVACNPSSLGANASSTCTVTLSKAAPVGGAVVTLASNNATLAVPASVTVAATATSAVFSATTGAVASDQSAIVTATYNGSSANTTVSLVAATLVSSVTCNPSSLGANAVSTCTVTLSKFAPAGGTVVTVASNNALLTVPASAPVAAGATTAIFNATAGATIGTNQSATITATVPAGSKTTTITLTVPILVSAAFVQENAVINGVANPSLISLTAPSANGNLIIIAVTQDNQTANVSSITDNKGNVYARALPGMNWGANGTEARSELWYAANVIGGATKISASVQFSVKPVSFVQLYISEYSGVAPTSALDQVSGRAATGSFAGTFSSGARLTTSASEVIFAHCEMWNGYVGVGSGFTTHSTFNGNIEASKNVSTVGTYDANCIDNGQGPMTIMATFRAATSSPPVTLPNSRTSQTANVANTTFESSIESSVETEDDVLKALSCLPNIVTAGTQVNCELLMEPRAGSFDPTLESTSDEVRVPASVSTRPNQSRLTFRAVVEPTARQGSVAITASFGGRQFRSTIQVLATPRPVLSAPGKLNGRIGSPLSFSVRATDPNDLPVRLAAMEIPRGAAFDEARGRFEWIPGIAQAGDYEVTFVAANSVGQKSTTQVALRIDSDRPLDSPVSISGAGLAPQATESSSPRILFVSHAGQKALVTHRDYTMTSFPAQTGDEILVWANGFAEVPATTGSVRIQIGGIDAEVKSIEAAPGFSGITAVRIKVPSGVGYGAMPVRLFTMSARGIEAGSNGVDVVIEP